MRATVMELVQDVVTIMIETSKVIYFRALSDRVDT